jgi:hypothetical protein
MSALSYLIGGVVVYGGIGWLAARFLHLEFLIPLGIVFGSGLSVYLIVRRFGKPGDQAVESWIEQKKAKEAEWARKAGRPDRALPSAQASVQTTERGREDHPT